MLINAYQVSRFNCTYTRYIAKIRLNIQENLATLIFFEIINQYRYVELLHLQFSPTPWDQVILEVRHDLERMLVRYSRR
jgi:hypothetical protein